MHTYIHPYIHMYVRTYVPTYIHTYLRMYIRTYIRTYVRHRLCFMMYPVHMQITGPEYHSIKYRWDLPLLQVGLQCLCQCSY